MVAGGIMGTLCLVGIVLLLRARFGRVPGESEFIPLPERRFTA